MAVRRIEELLDEACERTGVSDFGRGAWRDGLEVILDAAAREGELNELGEAVLHGWILRRLVCRLQVVDWVARHPEVERQRVERPLIVLGMLRTGTTILYELLGRDPANRMLMKWEALDCVPPPEAAHFHDDPRIAKMTAEMDAVYGAQPDFRAVHYEPGDGVTECVALLGQAFRSQDWLGLFHVPSYVRWYLDCDLLPAYEYHRLALKLLQTKAPGRWTLKAPGHMLALDAIRRVYPDARLIVTHRDPLETVPSSASLSTSSRGDALRHTRATHHEYFGRLWLDMLGTMVDRMIDFRERHGSEDVYDLHYDDLVRDPVDAVDRVYRHFGDQLGDEARHRMRTHLDASPRGKYGSHHYTLEQFGLTGGEVRERFAGYCRRFDVACGEARA